MFVDRHVEKESLADYITKKREMFLIQVISWYCNYFTIFFTYSKRDISVTG